MSINDDSNTIRRRCPKCGHPRESEWRFCPMCARELEPMSDPRMPELSALVACPDRDIQELLRRIENPDLVHALADPTWEPLKARVLSNVSKGAQRLLEDEWSYRNSDDASMARAQRRVLQHALELDEWGYIRLPRAGEVWVTPKNLETYADPDLEAAVAALDEAGILRVLKGMDKKTMTLALFAASPANRRAFYDQMSTRAVELMEEEIRETLDALRLEDLQTAQAELRGLVEAERDGVAFDLPSGSEGGDLSTRHPQSLHVIATPGGLVFNVMDLPGAEATFQDFDAVISLLDPGTALDWPHHPFHRVYGIRDVARPAGPSLEVMREILSLDFGQAQRVLVHCEVGVSRSPALTILLASRWGASEEAILEGINWRAASPNRRIIELGEAILGTGGRLQSLVERGAELGRLAMGDAQPHAEPHLGGETPARHRIHLPGGRFLDVSGLPEALERYQGYDAVVSLQDPWVEVTWGYHPRHWIFRVRDIEGKDEYAPSLELVREILSLDLGNALNVLVHCHEGFSRSTATAILLATRLGASEEAILEGIDWTHAYPNRRILAFGEAELGTNGRLAALVEEGLKRGGWL